MIDHPQSGSEPFDPQRSPWSEPSGLRAGYRGQLEALDGQLVALGRAVVTLAADIAGDDGRFRTLPPDAAATAREDLSAIQRHAGQIEDAAFTLVALESPVGSDLREVVAVIRALYDLSRAGRLAVHVLDGLVVLEACGVATGSGSFGEMRHRSVQLLQRAVEAWERRDALAHNDLRCDDDHIDGLRNALLDDHPAYVDPRCITAHVLAVRFLERLADHAVDVTAHLSWAVTGDRVLADFGGGP